MKIVTVFEREELRKLQSGIIVECWEKVMGSGSKRRKYNEEFTEEERKYIKYKHEQFRRWHLVTGIPASHRMSVKNYALIQRAVNFFATV